MISHAKKRESSCELPSAAAGVSFGKELLRLALHARQQHSSVCVQDSGRSEDGEGDIALPAFHGSDVGAVQDSSASSTSTVSSPVSVEARGSALPVPL